MSNDETESLDGDGEWKEDGRTQRFFSRNAERQANLDNPAKMAKRLDLRRGHERTEEEKRIKREIASVLEDMKDPCTPERLAANLRTLLASRGWTLQEAAMAIPVLNRDGRAGYRWLKRLTKDGLSQVSGRTKQRLTVVASFFGYTLEQLRSCDIDLIKEVERSNQPPSKEMACFGSMLLSLLTDGEHAYLIGVLDALLPADILGQTPSCHPSHEANGVGDPALGRYMRAFYGMPDGRERHAVCALVGLLHEKMLGSAPKATVVDPG